MAFMSSVLGLDVGSHTIKAVELRQFREVEAVQMRVQSRPTPDTSLDEVLPPFIRTFELPVDKVIACLPGDRLSVRRMQFPFRDRKRLRAAVPFEVEGETPFELSDVIADWEIIGSERDRAELAVCIAPRSLIEQRLAELDAAGCEPRVLEAEGMVLANLATTLGWEGTQLVADIGHLRTRFCVVRDGKSLAARTIGLGGHHITAAMAEDLGIPLEEAESAKCEDGIFSDGFGSASPRALEVLDRISREASRVLGGVEDLLGGPSTQMMGGFVLLGGSARLHRLDEYLSERTGIAAARPQVPPEGEGAALLAAGDPALFGPALALALRGTSRSTTHLDFRQEEFGYKTDLRNFLGKDLRPTALLAGGAAALGLAWAGTSMTIDSQRAEATQAEVLRLYQEALPDAPVPANPSRSLAEQIDQARELADFLGVYGGNHSALDLLAELSTRIPNDLDVRFEEVNITGRVIRIKVSARTFEASERLTKVIAASPPFQAAEVKGSIETNRGGGKTFTVAISLSGGNEEAS